MAATFRTRPLLAALILVAYASFALAHGGHEHVAEGEAVSHEPLDTTLWIHILLQILAWAILFPSGMVLGLVRSRWHVPVQILGSCIAIVGYFLGHAHRGRQFGPNAHAKFANLLMLLWLAQAVLGVYLKMHIEKGWLGHVRKAGVKIHGVLGCFLPVAAWTQMLLGGIASQGYCQGDHLGQCLAHFIMGSAFIAYGIVMTILLLCGQNWLAKKGRSQEFFDSSIITAWGVVNTFTEHRWGTAWVKNDLQHTSMGIIWWAAGLVGIWLSSDRQGRPKRNLVPAIVILLTGWGMGGHPQSLALSTHVHTIFGYTLMAGGLARIIEISFVLKDRVVPINPNDIDSEINSFQYLPPFLLYASGFLFMGATEEQMAFLSNAGVTHVSYILILYSIAFLLFFFVLILLHLYSKCSVPSPGKAKPESRTLLNGRHSHDEQEFELEGLMSDDDESKPDYRQSTNGS
ncbi:integral membrane protein [Piedraia hortae CBS 480.64]|uniref:Integral membrane protein n=1 Tax=Piedraia hortae CBS 480.64 TaxID=1314780 RepID=A0A6A7C487_9PEZI|nr:integral membrane protein [Piedraia hortae CBS 480.64]